MNFYLKRLREPSTWAGLAVLSSLFGVVVPPGASEAVAQVGAGIAALVAVFRSEGK